MRIFVTGGTGFIGKPAVEELKKRGHELLVLSRTPHAISGVRFVRGDLSNSAKWRGQLKKFKPEAAVHLAWEGMHDFAYQLCVDNLYQGLSLFSVLAEIGCSKIVALGTGFELGGQVGKVGEEIGVIPTSLATSGLVAVKQAQHLLGAKLANEKGTDFIWLRPFTLYGIGQRPASLIPSIIRSITEKKPLVLRAPLVQADWVYVDDVAAAIADAVEKGKGQVTYNVGSGKLTAVRDIAKIICEEMGVDKAYWNAFARTAKGKPLPAPYAELRNTRKGITWRPKTTIRAGLRRIVRASMAEPS